MRARTIIAIVGLGVVTAVTTGCGSDKTATTTPSKATTAPTTTAPTTTSEVTAPATTTPSTQFAAKLLTANDVGTGWEIGSDINPMDLSSFAQVPCPEGALDPAITKRLTAVTGIQFQPSDGSSKHLIELVVTGDAKQLDGDLKALFAAVDSCPTATPTSGGATLTINKLDLPNLGDQRAGYAATVFGYNHAAVVRMGSIAISIGLTEIPAPQDKPTISDQAFIALLQTAVAKFG